LHGFYAQQVKRDRPSFIVKSDFVLHTREAILDYTLKLALWAFKDHLLVLSGQLCVANKICKNWDWRIL
jgi:hypothetical protein